MSVNPRLIDQIKLDFRNGNRQKAIGQCENLSYLNPKSIELKKLLGLMQASIGNLSIAKRAYEQAYQLNSDDQEVLFNLGIISRNLNEFQDAINWFEKLITLDEQSVDDWGCLGEVQFQLKRYEDCVYSCERAISINDSVAGVWNNKGKALMSLKKIEEARFAFERAIQLDPQNFLFIYNLAELYSEIKKYDQAIELFGKVIQINPGFYQAWLNIGVCHYLNNNPRVAIPFLEKAIQLEPQNPLAHIKLSLALFEVNQKNISQQQINKALILNPTLPAAWIAKAQIYSEDDLLTAISAYEKVEQLDPNTYGNLDYLCHSKLLLGDWMGIETVKQKIRLNEIDVTTKFIPFGFSALLDDPEKQLRVAQEYASRKFEHINHESMTHSKTKNKIRIAYISPDYHEHPVTYLITELIETHSREDFEIYGFSYKDWPNGEAKSRIMASFDHFIDISNFGVQKSVELIRSYDIDVAIDLCGYTAHGKSEIFAHRVAPVQMSYLGYLGTMGSRYYDYLVADRTLVPKDYERYYSEKLIFLPSYQVNDTKRTRPEKPSDIKEQLGISKDCFVFASLNNVFKYNPEVFNAWINILNRVPNSVLCLYANHEIAQNNFKQYFEKNNIDLSRIIFLKRVKREKYLENFHAVDLFLDTWPYNAGTTASDALWMGVPVLTKIGAAFQSRMAASVLQAAGLPDLITLNIKAYEDMAVKIALDKEHHGDLLNRLKNNINTSLLFDIDQFKNSIEKAFHIVFKSKANQEPLEHIEIN